MPTPVIGIKAIVVGASSGIGEEIARQIAEGGGFVATVARRTDRMQPLADRFPERVFPFGHDVRDIDEVPELFQKCTDALGGLDLIVYCAGVMPPVGPHEYNTEKDLSMIAINNVGAVAWLNAAATRMEAAGHGSIIGIGSVAGDRGRFGQPVYNASKAFLHTYLEALRNRLAKKGVKVVTIKPGPTATEMTADLNLKGAMPAPVAAAKIIALKDRTGEHYLKFAHRIVFAVIKAIPSPIFRRLKV
ncbi:MAG: SDR family NAD(P)-dependent oxidoreductase [Fimbriimonadaceae bacterium]|nr:SDR family NAD(P)-dependent oxidoreductase [Fimbriimonadaceae bacterium]